MLSNEEKVSLENIGPEIFETHPDGPRRKRRSKSRMNNKKHTRGRLRYGFGRTAGVMQYCDGGNKGATRPKKRVRNTKPAISTNV